MTIPAPWQSTRDVLAWAEARLLQTECGLVPSDAPETVLRWRKVVAALRLFARVQNDAAFLRVWAAQVATWGEDDDPIVALLSDLAALVAPTDVKGAPT